MAKSNADTIAAAALGRAVMAEEQVAQLSAFIAAATARIERMENLVKFLEANLKQLTQPRTLLTEKEAAEMLRVHSETLRKWRHEKPTPRLKFIPFEGGDIRYRVEDIESYLKSRERGEKKTALRVA
jgi:excisionase family DNA binding protein